jgi:hypothetical protein
MLFWTNGRKVYFDFLGRVDAPVVYFAHSLAADSGMWSEQVSDFLAAGYRDLVVALSKVILITFPSAVHEVQKKSANQDLHL